MKFLHIHNTTVPALGFGTWQLAGSTCTDAVLDAIEIGYRHIDTAQMYKNERQVGHAIELSTVPREQFFITSKLARDHLTPQDVRRTARESLDRLAVDYLDLLLIHWPNDQIPLEQTLDAMNDLHEAGLVRHIGVSNFTPSLVARAARYTRIFCNQVEYHVLLSQTRLIEQARTMGHMITAYSPLARGRAFDCDYIRRIAEAHHKMPSQIMLRWLLEQDPVAAIPRSSDRHHRRLNFDIFDFSLTDAEFRKIADHANNKRLVNPQWAPSWER